MTTRRAVLIGCAGAGLAQPAWAHRLARTETDVRIATDGTVAVTHVYHIQDAQTALYKAGLLERPDLSSLRARAQLALYTASNFALIVGDEPIQLDIVGAEIEGDSVFVYQEGRLSDGDLTVSASMLRELVHGQRNSVNIVKNGQTQTLDFSGDDGPKPVA